MTIEFQFYQSFLFSNFPLFSVQNKRIYIINFFPKIDYFVIITTVFFLNKTNNLLIRVCLVNWVGIYGTYIYIYMPYNFKCDNSGHKPHLPEGKIETFQTSNLFIVLFSLYAELFSQRRPIQTKKWPRPPSLLKGRRFLKECFITVVIWTSCAQFFFQKYNWEIWV